MSYSDDGGIQWFQQAQEERRQIEEWLADRKAQLEYLDLLDWLSKEQNECPRSAT